MTRSVDLRREVWFITTAAPFCNNNRIDHKNKHNKPYPISDITYVKSHALLMSRIIWSLVKKKVTLNHTLLLIQTMAHRGGRGDDQPVLVLDRAWFNVQLPLRTCSLKELATSIPTKTELDKYFQEAQEALDGEVHQGQHDKGRWYMQQFQSRGTVTDKVASAAVKLTDYDFMFFMEGFNLLFETARTDSHHFDAALKALAAVWPKLLPARPLKKFAMQHFATMPVEGIERKRVLVYWYLEDYLKRTYAQFLSLCEGMLKDKMLHRREAWLDVAGKLLLNIAEGRNVLISLIVDKLGDPMSQVAHKAYHCILAMLTESSTNQAALLAELEKVVFMKNCPLRPMKYCVNVINQLVFSKEERKLALRCVETYLRLFRDLVVTDRVEQSVTSAIITGIRRAFPYAGTDHSPLAEHINALFVLANTGAFTQRVSTLSLLQQLITKGTPAAYRDRWFRALYSSLLISPKQLPQAAQLSGLFSMLHKALRTDTNSERVAAFVHRLLQRSLFFSEAFICAVLLLVGELMQTNPAIRSLIRPQEKKPEGCYDSKHRDPQHSGATKSLVWTLNLLCRHSHPSVVKLAVLLLFGEELAFDSHPLDDLTLGNFLQMFVDAKHKSEDVESKDTKGVPVFRRAVHVPNIPSASDDYFRMAAPGSVDVSAIFLHRYAVQRQRFLDGLSHVKTSWGEACGEEEVPTTLTNTDALFGPDGGITAKVAKKDQKKKDAKKKAEEVKAGEEEGDDEEDEAQEEAVSSSAASDGEFDADPDDGDLSWGSDDDIAYEDFDASTDEDDDDDEEEVIGSKKKHSVVGDVDAEEFEALIEENKAKNKKRERDDEFLDKRAQRERTFEYRGRGGGRGFGRGSSAPFRGRR